MTAREVVDLIKQNAGAPWNERSYRDTFKVGNPDTPVQGIATTMMTTFGMLKRAHEAGLNMVICARGYLLERSRRYERPDGQSALQTQNRVRSEKRHGGVARSRSHAFDEARLHSGRRASFGRHQGR